ncbi:enoyl-CoA hydratase/isomerase family protein [Mycobacterium avium]|jgi:2-(1,2-epoxy-1,2-dihydrophenyl)acetyl-CoA isomerase|uniref:enoyl-CoA hydratase/isomerase family protein n=1 Tax=Mycobacterium avium TaxID=1764 RepID=UPI0004F80E0D|nr:enoyl-CoA hydratase-related protein [Mycobacterium avium]MBZ4507938.1 enoyl-CoA hydratase [Mycobacterium avium subsp. hominissuis]MBZ4517843.1 enoyl-CoA hydratase [Mycobacterium avium subsp. hominissuis]MBZ4527711.1 enoyl-CoA hydratase [Mycobacterium avium subsp. hominissuis]MBZ4546921.1 enoyl-CoA hydratase [Mycobacterium avium subsp. hominissuis]MBZ4556602.1 enoyl-CoA hydratase [Mycobacterium avium subsp. hominissuis]
MSTNTVLSDLTDGIMTITLNRPDAANAVRPDDRDTLIALLEAADADEKVRVVVLRANGKHFCSGADVTALADRRGRGEKRVLEPTRRIMNGAQKLVASVLDCNKPVIAAVHGAATGLGAHIVYASDLVIATENAYFAESFVKRGLVVDGGGCYLLPRRIGMQKAKEMAFFGERLSAAEALALGLVNRVVGADEFDAAVADFAGRLAQAPTSAIAFTKRLLNDSPDTDRSGAFVAEAMAQEIQSYAHDSKEGVQAFVEKRPTEFTGW